MREIKFRAWDKDLKRMRTVKEMSLISNRIMVGDGNEMGTKLFGDEFILMQYTGLKDKKGVEIYEGDILSVDCTGARYEKKEWKENFEVKWSDDGYRAGEWSLFDHVKYRQTEVIGNIYENPELLN